MNQTSHTTRPVYQLKVTLDCIKPRIWRRLVVPSDIMLDKLHEVLQVAMGWTNSHLHQFIVGKTYWGTTAPEAAIRLWAFRDGNWQVVTDGGPEVGS